MGEWGVGSGEWGVGGILDGFVKIFESDLGCLFDPNLDS